MPLVGDVYWTGYSTLPLAFGSQALDTVRYLKARLQSRQVHSLDLLGFRLKLLGAHAGMAQEELGMWEANYLPTSLDGKTVLDVGAGCGETAALFIFHGAKKVIAIEPDELAFGLLRENIEANSLDVVPLKKSFELRDLLIPHDFLKMDAEGAETLLLDYGGKLGDCVIETHSVGFPRICVGPLIAERFGLRVRLKFGHNNGVWVLTS